MLRSIIWLFAIIELIILLRSGGFPLSDCLSIAPGGSALVAVLAGLEACPLKPKATSDVVGILAQKAFFFLAL